MKRVYVFLISFLCGLATYSIGYFWFFPTPASFHEIESAYIVYEGYRGYLVEPIKKKSAYPGVVMIHEWWGLNEYVKDTARSLAREGYRVLAVDLFGTVATTAEQARAQVAALDTKKAQNNLDAAVVYLRTSGSSKIASLGWCFGGGQAFNLAVSGTPVEATVIYYGAIATSTDTLSKVSAPILGIFGELDRTISTTTVRAYHDGLVSLNKPRRTIVYPGVGHAFANPSNVGFAQKETAHAWNLTLNFLNHYLKDGPDLLVPLMPLE